MKHLAFVEKLLDWRFLDRKGDYTRLLQRKTLMLNGKSINDTKSSRRIMRQVLSGCNSRSIAREARIIDLCSKATMENVDA